MSVTVPGRFRPYLHPIPRAAASVTYTPVDLARLYGFPQATGKGQLIGIIELGGALNTRDLTQYLQSVSVPHSGKVQAVTVDGAKPVSDGPNGADGEVMLDVEIAAALAPAADLNVYFAPNTDAGFLDAINQAVKDGCHIISISWGGPEDQWTAGDLKQFDAAFAAAAAQGVTVLVAAGDSGSSDGESGSHVDFPASSPNVTACGGTRLTSTTETVWNDSAKSSATGGGYSSTFPKPAYQTANTKAKRGVPDVAGDADPVTGYEVLVDGQSLVFGGTSAVAPLWAGLVARLNELAGRSLGFLNPLLYQSKPTKDITTGSNGSYKAAVGWDPCTGLGSPDGAKLVAATGTVTPPPPTPVDAVDRAAALAVLDQARAQIAALKPASYGTGDIPA